MQLEMTTAVENMLRYLPAIVAVEMFPQSNSKKENRSKSEKVK